MQAKKSLGQNFLVNENIVDKISSLIDSNEDDLIVEIGPGRGALTKKMVNKKGQYIAIEIDTDMKTYLDKYKVTIVYDDILNVDLLELLKDYKYKNLYVVGNLPYYITSPILEKLVNSNIDICKMIFMVQKEVALRYAAKEGTKNYGYMSVFLQYRYNVTKEFDVLRNNFNPIPNVDSSIIMLTNRHDENDIDFNSYVNFLKKAFHMKRKTLKNNLVEYNWEKARKVLGKYNISESVRAENISREIFIELFREIKND